jgi:hypothetical protein
LRSASTSYGGVLEAKACRDRLDHTIAEVAAAPPYREIVARLSCLRGVSTLTALALTVELGDWQRLRPSLALAGRRAGQSAAARSDAEAIARRLHRRWWDLGRRGKRRTIVVVAVACELARHCWKLVDTLFSRELGG